MIDFKNRVGVKVCGVTNLADAIGCAKLGVDLLGLNFSPRSPRCISRRTAVEILDGVRGQFADCKFVGVFLNQDLNFVKTTVLDFGLEAVQLHGDESPEYADQVEAPFAIKAIRVGPHFSLAAVARYRCHAVLLDSWCDLNPGGTGKTFPWSEAAKQDGRVERLILAGGLTSENVARAISVVRPFAVDVCSGVEMRPGKKNLCRVKDFLQAVRQASTK